MAIQALTTGKSKLISPVTKSLGNDFSGHIILTKFKNLPQHQSREEVGILIPVARESPLPSLCHPYGLSYHSENGIEVTFSDPFQPYHAMIVNIARQGCTDEVGDTEPLNDVLGTGQNLKFLR